MPGALQAAPFIALGLVLVTLPHHWRVRNIATLSIIAWLSAYNIIFGVNAIIWDGNVEIRARVWCDIATKIKIGADAALPGCALCMARQLNRIACGLEMSPKGWRHRAPDILLCWGLPVIIMAAHYIVQGHRFDIIEDLGCFPAIYISLPSIFILDLSQFIPGVLALVFCSLALWKLHRRRVAFHIMLKAPGSSLSPSRYIRLMIMTFFIGTWSALLSAVSTANEYNTGLEPWTNWTAVHADFSFIGQDTDSDFASTPGALTCIYLLWWAVPLSSLSFFGFFGIGEEAMKDYQANANWVRRVILGREPEPVPSNVASVDADWRFLVYSGPPAPRAGIIDARNYPRTDSLASVGKRSISSTRDPSLDDSFGAVGRRSISSAREDSLDSLGPIGRSNISSACEDSLDDSLGPIGRSNISSTRVDSLDDLAEKGSISSVRYIRPLPPIPYPYDVQALNEV
jgi:pheromone a factor receptor